MRHLAVHGIEAHLDLLTLIAHDVGEIFEGGRDELAKVIVLPPEDGQEAHHVRHVRRLQPLHQRVQLLAGGGARVGEDFGALLAQERVGDRKSTLGHLHLVDGSLAGLNLGERAVAQPFPAGNKADEGLDPSLRRAAGKK